MENLSVIPRCRTPLCNFLAIALLLRSSPSKGEGEREIYMVDKSQDSRLRRDVTQDLVTTSYNHYSELPTL